MEGITTLSEGGTAPANPVETTEGVPLYTEGGRGMPAGVIGLVCMSTGGIAAGDTCGVNELKTKPGGSGPSSTTGADVDGVAACILCDEGMFALCSGCEWSLVGGKGGRGRSSSALRNAREGVMGTIRD